VTGTSVGAIVGAAYSLNKLDRLSKFIGNKEWKETFREDLMLKSVGGISFNDVTLRRIFGENIAIKDMPINFSCVGCDMKTGDEIIFKGDDKLFESLKMTSAIPGVVTPIKHNGKWIIDGGTVDPVPVEECFKNGADFVIAVNLHSDKSLKNMSKKSPVINEINQTLKTETDRPTQVTSIISTVSKYVPGGLAKYIPGGGLLGGLSSMFGRKPKIIHLPPDNSLSTSEDDPPAFYRSAQIAFDILMRQIAKTKLAVSKPDIILHPVTINSWEWTKFDDGIEQGRQIARENIEIIKRLIEEKKINKLTLAAAAKAQNSQK